MYLVRKKNAKTAHIWTGYDTACRMYSTGGLRKKAYEVVKSCSLPTCNMCENKKAVFPTEQSKLEYLADRQKKAPVLETWSPKMTAELEERLERYIKENNLRF